MVDNYRDAEKLSLFLYQYNISVKTEEREEEEMSLQEQAERVKDFRLIDDVFFEVFANDIPACQEILQTILEDHKLIVKDVIVQSSERNLYGRSVRLDALCILGNGSLCNIEIQRSNNDNHFKRVRFNASSITVKESETGTSFEKVKDVYIIYISETDFIGDGLTTYHVDKCIRENGKVVDDGLHEIFVNTAIYDGSDIAELMQCFKQKNLDNPKFPAVTKRFKELKTTEGGLNAVCEVMENLLKEENVKRIKKMIEAGFTKEQIVLVYSESEYEEAEKSLLTTV